MAWVKRNETHRTPHTALHSCAAMVGQSAPVDVGGVAQQALEQSARLYAALFYGVILLLVLAFGTYLLLRMSRRYKERLAHKPAKPTPTPDIWSMHQPPGFDDPDKPDEELDHEP